MTDIIALPLDRRHKLRCVCGAIYLSFVTTQRYCPACKHAQYEAQKRRQSEGIRLRQHVATSADDAPDRCRDGAKTWRVLVDPSPYPLEAGKVLSSDEVKYMLQYGCFVDGTLLEKRGIVYKVKTRRIVEVK